MSWRKWGDLLVDTGRELDLPRRLAEGQVLYRDARFYYGPLAPYLNALLYRIFGVHLDVLVWAGIAAGVLLCIGLYRLATFFIPRWPSAMVVIGVIYTCCFAHLYVPGIFNFVLPYTFAATYGIVAAIWSLVLLLQHLRSGRQSALALSIACLGLAALSKIEAFAPAAAAHGLFVGARLFSKSPFRRRILAGYAAVAGAVGVVYGYLWAVVGPSLWRSNLLGVVNRGSHRFVTRAMGLEDPGTSLKAVGLSLLLLGITLLVASIVARFLSRRRLPRSLGWVLVCAMGLATFVGYRQWQLHVHFRALPLVMICALVLLSILYLRQPERRDEWLVHILLWAFAFASLWRILLNSKPQHYGFYLLPPGLVCIAVLIFDYGPRFLCADGWARRVFTAAGIGLLAASATLAFSASKELYALHTSELVTPRGRLLIQNRWGLERAAVQALAGLPASTRFAAVPEGSGLLFFSGLREGDAMFSYLPMEVIGPAEDAELLRRWKQSPPDLIGWISIPMAEFGSAGFGKDYAQNSVLWILNEYVPVSDTNAGIVLLEYGRRSDRSVGRVALAPDGPITGETISGLVLDSSRKAGVTFLHLKTETSKVWVAISGADVSPGSWVTVRDTKPGYVEELGFLRQFDRVLWGQVTAINPPGGAAERLRGGAQRAHGDRAQRGSPLDSGGGLTVSQVLSQRASLQDRPVTVRGTVVKFSPQIMGKNWIHLRDSSGSGGDRQEDLTVTAQERVNVGDVVLVRGVLRLDRRLAGGLSYPVLIDDATIVRMKRISE